LARRSGRLSGDPVHTNRSGRSDRYNWSGDEGWRRSQRRRRQHRLTPRGRVTLLVVCAGLVLPALAVSYLFATGHAWARSVDPDLPRVSAGAPAPLRPLEPTTPSLPPEILERLPVTRAALALPTHFPERAHPGPSGGRLYEVVDLPGGTSAPDGSALPPGPIRVEYTLDAQLTRDVFETLRRGRVALGHVIVLDPFGGRVLAYASTDVNTFPPTRAYPAASLVKVITAAAALDRDRTRASLPCRFRGSPYRLTRSRIDPPQVGREISLRRALATSNNQCFAQLAVHAVGERALVDAIQRFGWLSRPAPAHAAGELTAGEDRFELGKLGCGLDGCRITPLHAGQLAMALARGERIAPRWIERAVAADGTELQIPASPTPRRVMSPQLADELRSMLVDTTKLGTARRAFRTRRGRPLLDGVDVAGKTGSLSSTDPTGRYEWFIGVAPADAPRIAIAVLLVQGDLYWKNASGLAGEVLRKVFCPDRQCSAEAAERWTRSPVPASFGATAATEPGLEVESGRAG
jgi:hypothetical protein